MSLSISPTLALASCDLHVDAIDAGTGETAGYFEIYSGAVPNEVTDALISGENELLISMAMANPAFGAAADVSGDGLATATAEAIAELPALADGVAAFYRQYDRDGNALWQGTVTGSNLGGDMEISNTSVVTGVGVVVLSYTFSIPYGQNA